MGLSLASVRQLEKMECVNKFQFTGKKKVAFDIVIEKDTCFEAKHAIGRNSGKLPVIKMSFAFDPSVEAGPSW